MSVISADPGKRTGWAKWSDDGILIDCGILFEDEFLEWLQDEAPRVFVVEDYILDHRAGKQKGSKLEAAQVKGAIRLRARQVGAIVALQRQESRDMGYVHAGLKKSTNHNNSHHLDAIAHGFWWFESQGIEPSLPAVID